MAAEALNAMRRTSGAAPSCEIKEPSIGSRRSRNLSPYNPARIIGAYKTPMYGDIYQHDKLCTSHVERHNGSIRSFCQTNEPAQLCVLEALGQPPCGLALFFCHYNYCRKHQALKGQTPTMAHGLSTEVWSVRKMLNTVPANA
jgi:hypothetical protein